MSYNPSAWHTRQLKDLWVSIEELHALGFRVWSKAVIGGGYGEPSLDLPDYLGDCEIEIDEIGIHEGEVKISKFDIGGEIYRDDYEKIQRLLSKTIGFIEYVLVWESGDSVEIVTYTDGVVNVEQIT